MKKIIYQKRYLIFDFFILILILSFAGWYFFSEKSQKNNFVKKQKIWQTVEVKVAQDFASIKIPAKVKSNQFAIISPRRNGIVQDLLVDIGDEIYKGQTIGSMLPEGVEGQSSAAIAEASARLQKARSELSNSKGVAIDSVSVATKQWRESNFQSQTQDNLHQESQKQLNEKKSEAILVATQSWESTKLILFGTGSNNSSRDIQGNFANSIQKNNVKNLANKIQSMEESNLWNNPEKILEHLSHLENFLTQAEILYKNAHEGRGLTNAKIINNLKNIQNQQVRISQIKQSILSLEEKSQRFTSIKAEKDIGIEKSREILDLVQSQQNLTTTQVEKNVQVARANYNAALVKSGHQSITSPFGGTITARMVEIGQSVTLNSPLFYLEGANTTRSQESLFEIHFNLSESWKNKISVGDKIMLKSMDGESFDGEIFRLSPQINLESHSILATAIIVDDLEKKFPENLEENNSEEESTKTHLSRGLDKKLSHGQSLFIYLTASENYIFTVPTIALKKRSNQYFLWKMEGKKPQQIKIEVVAEDGEFSQVFSRALTEKDLIIRNPSSSLFKK